MYNLNEYSDNYSDSIASLYHYKRQEALADNADDANALVGDNANWQNAQIIVALKYISSFFRSIEMPLINTKLYRQLNYTKNSVISDAAGASAFKTTKTELYVPVATLKTEDNNKLNELLGTEFERTINWNEYKSKIEIVTQEDGDVIYKRTLLDTAIPGVNR